MFLERDPLPTPFRRTGGVRTDISDQHGLDTAYQIRQALAWLGVGEAFWEQGRAWLARSLGAWLRPVKQTWQDAENGRAQGKGMEPDDLLCSRNARPEKALVGRAQWKINQPPSLERIEQAWREYIYIVRCAQ